MKDVLPAGFYFTPTPEQLIKYYLKPKLVGDELPCDVVQDRVVFGTGPDANPWNVFHPKNDAWIVSGKEKVIYVFVHQTKVKSDDPLSKNKKSTRACSGRERYHKRAGCGTWHGDAAPKKITDRGTGKVIGEERMLAFQVNDDRGIDVDTVGYWKMHQYSLLGYSSDLVLCKITLDYSKKVHKNIKDRKGTVAKDDEETLEGYAHELDGILDDTDDQPPLASSHSGNVGSSSQQIGMVGVTVNPQSQYQPAPSFSAYLPSQVMLGISEENVAYPSAHLPSQTSNSQVFEPHQVEGLDEVYGSFDEEVSWDINELHMRMFPDNLGSTDVGIAEFAVIPETEYLQTTPNPTFPLPVQTSSSQVSGSYDEEVSWDINELHMRMFPANLGSTDMGIAVNLETEYLQTTPAPSFPLPMQTSSSQVSEAGYQTTPIFEDGYQTTPVSMQTSTNQATMEIHGSSSQEIGFIGNTVNPQPELQYAPSCNHPDLPSQTSNSQVYEPHQVEVSGSYDEEVSWDINDMLMFPEDLGSTDMGIAVNPETEYLQTTPAPNFPVQTSSQVFEAGYQTAPVFQGRYQNTPVSSFSHMPMQPQHPKKMQPQYQPAPSFPVPYHELPPYNSPDRPDLLQDFELYQVEDLDVSACFGEEFSLGIDEEVSAEDIMGSTIDYDFAVFPVTQLLGKRRFEPEAETSEHANKSQRLMENFPAS